MKVRISKLMMQALLSCLLTVAGAQACWAGGGIYPFRQTWTVRWATTEDSLQFGRDIAPGGNAACDAAVCELCRFQSGPDLIDLRGCAGHGQDSAHACVDSRRLEGQFSRNAMGKPAADACHRDACGICVARTTNREVSKICGHHAGGVAHNCHGKSLTEIRTVDQFEDRWIPQLQGWGSLGTAVTVAEDMEGHARVIELIKAAPRPVPNESAAIAANFLPETPQEPIFTDGRFTLVFQDAGPKPIHLQVFNSEGMVVMRLLVHEARQSLDLRTWPKGLYAVEGRTGAEDRWSFVIGLGAGTRPQAMGGDILPKN